MSDKPLIGAVIAVTIVGGLLLARRKLGWRGFIAVFAMVLAPTVFFLYLVATARGL